MCDWLWLWLNNVVRKEQKKTSQRPLARLSCTVMLLCDGFLSALRPGELCLLLLTTGDKKWAEPSAPIESVNDDKKGKNNV